MILVCPECTTKYDLPGQLPDEGTKVRCMSCSHVWFATNADLLEAEAELPPEPEQEEDTATPDHDEADEMAVAAVSPIDDDPLEELDFNEIMDEPDEEAVPDEVLETPEEDDLLEAVAPEKSEEEVLPDEDAPQSQDDIDSMFDVMESGEEEVEEDTNDQGDIDNLFAEEGSPEEEAGAEEAGDEPEAEVETEPAVELEIKPDDAEEERSQGDIDNLFETEQEDEAPALDEQTELEAFTSAISDLVDDEVDPFDHVAPEEAEELEAGNADILRTRAKVPFWKQLDQKTMIGWACYGVMIFFIGLFFVSARVTVVRAFPAMAEIYSAIGLGVNVRGVMFTNVQQRWDIVDNILKLKVDGEIVNLTNHYKPLPDMVFVAMNQERREVFRWVTRVRQKPLLPGEKAPFIAKVPAPPESARHLLLYFE